MDGINNSRQINEQLAETFNNSGRYNPIFLLIAGLGVLTIYLFTQNGILGDPAPRLLVVGGAIILLAIAQWFILRFLAQRGKGVAAYLVSAAFIAVFAVCLSFVWQNFFYLSILLILILPMVEINAGMPRRTYPWLAVIVLTGIVGTLLADRFAASLAGFGRLQFNSTSALSSLAFLGAASLLLVTIGITVQNRYYKSLQSLLLASFIVIVTIPTVMTTVLSGAGAYANSQAQTFNILKAIAGLKENQITQLVNGMRGDAEKIQEDVRFKQNILPLLAAGDQEPDQIATYRSLARSYLVNIQQDQQTYAEILILDTKGTLVLSTDARHTAGEYENQMFYRQGTVKPFAGFADIAEFGNENLVISTPLFDSNGQVIRGVIVLRSDAQSIKQIMESTPGFLEAETYLVNRDYIAVTQTRTASQTIRTQAATAAIIDNAIGQASYTNYNGENVLGYYKWYEPMQMAIIAEVPVRYVISSSISSLAGSSLLALFVIVIAIAAVAIAARSISDPIIELARVTESYSAGKFRVRAAIDRRDEIGALAAAYNQMASQLQDIIGKLEQRVADRTHELESQTRRVRMAAEIARDAASSREISELLTNSATLIHKRFDLYQTGIFLVDKNHEFAVLTASPTDTGRQMLSAGFKVRVGSDHETVGYVAASGEPRIVHDIQANKSSLLPNTLTEMVLPLKAGNKVIGVLDLQSDRSQAFSQDDIAIMQVLADQLATSLERSRLLDELERSLQEIETAYGRYTRDGWQRLGTEGILANRGYRFNNIRIESLHDLPKDTAPGADLVTVPVKLRGQEIGVIQAKLKEGYNRRTLSTLEAATERLAAALESARLYEEARSRADREQAIAQVTARISASTEVETILRTTVEEIGKSLGNTEVSIEIIPAPGEKTD